MAGAFRWDETLPGYSSHCRQHTLVLDLAGEDFYQAGPRRFKIHNVVRYRMKLDQSKIQDNKDN